MFFATEQRNDSQTQADLTNNEIVLNQLMDDHNLPNDRKELADLLLTLHNYPQLARAVADVLLLKKERQEAEPRLRKEKRIESLQNWDREVPNNEIRGEIVRKLSEKLGNGTFSSLYWEGYWGNFTEEEIGSLKVSFGSLHNARIFLDDLYFWQTKEKFGTVDFKQKTASLPRKISKQLSDERLHERTEKLNKIRQLSMSGPIKGKLKDDIINYGNYNKPSYSYFDLLSENEINYLSNVPGLSRDFRKLRKFLEIPLNEQDLHDIASQVRVLSPEDLPDEAFMTFLIEYYKIKKANGYLMYTDRSLAGGQGPNGFHEEKGGVRAASEILGVNVKVWKSGGLPEKLSASPENANYPNTINMLYNGYNHYDYLLFENDRDEILAHALWNAWHYYGLSTPVTEQTINQEKKKIERIQEVISYLDDWLNQNYGTVLPPLLKETPTDNNDVKIKKAYYEKEIDKSEKKVRRLQRTKEIQDFVAGDDSLTNMLDSYYSPLLRLRPINHPPRLPSLPFPKEALEEKAKKALKFDFQGTTREEKKQVFSDILAKAQEKSIEVDNTVTNFWIRAMDVIVKHTNPQEKAIGENFFKFFSSEQPTHHFRDRKTLGKAVSIVKRKARDLFVLSNYTQEEFKALILGSNQEEFNRKHSTQAVNTFIVSMLATGHKPSDTADIINSYYPQPHLMTPQKVQDTYDDLSSYER